MKSADSDKSYVLQVMQNNIYFPVPLQLSSINSLQKWHALYNFGNLTTTYCFIELHFYRAVTWKDKERSSTIHPILKYAILKRLLIIDRQMDASYKFLELYFWLLMNSQLIEKVFGCKFCIFKKRCHYYFYTSDKKLPEWLRKTVFSIHNYRKA